ncbi:MAG: hypothetical protein ACM3PP_01290 [Candidatus Saccharibacteria bacterium]
MPGHFFKSKPNSHPIRSSFILALALCLIITVIPGACLADQVTFSVPSIKFFENSSPSAPDLGSRQYATQFDRFKTRYVFAEIDVQRSVAGTAYDVPYRITWYDSHGFRASQETGTLHWEPANDTAKLVHVTGSRFTGIFFPGNYKVELSIDDKIVGQASFEITQSIFSLNPTVESLRFFESSAPAVDARSRKYSTSFSAPSTHYVWWELNTQYVVADTRLRIPVHVAIYRANASVARDDYTFTIDEGASASVFIGGFGSNTPGRIAAGTYKVIISVNSAELASGTFAVTQPAPKPVVKKPAPVKKPVIKKPIKKKTTGKK